MSDTKAAPKPKAYRIGGNGAISIPGFPFEVTEAMLNDPKHGYKFVAMLERHEKDNDVQLFGKVIKLA